MLKGVINILESDSDVSNIVSSRIYPLNGPQGVSYPYVVVELDGVEASDTKSGVSKLDTGTVTVSCHSKLSYEQLEDLSTKIRTALDRSSDATNNIQSIQFESRFDFVEYGDGFERLYTSEQIFNIREEK